MKRCCRVNLVKIGELFSKFYKISRICKLHAKNEPENILSLALITLKPRKTRKMSSFFPLLLLCLSLSSVHACNFDALRNQRHHHEHDDANANHHEDKDFRRVIQLEEPLYYGDSIREIRSLCTNSEQPSEKDMKFENLREKQSNCDHQPDTAHDKANTRKMTQIELFLLKEAQGKFRQQQELIQDIGPMVLACVMFFVPLALFIYLLAVGHYRIANLPLVHYVMRPRPGNSDGVKYNIFTWMKFRCLSGGHPEMSKSAMRKAGGDSAATASEYGEDRKKDRESGPLTKIKWSKYDKEDERLDPKKLVINLDKMNFRFQPRIDYLKLLAALHEEDASSGKESIDLIHPDEHPSKVKMVHKLKHHTPHKSKHPRGKKGKQMLTTKKGWTFVTDSATTLHPETHEKKQKKIVKRRLSHAAQTPSIQSLDQV